jgi:hypothetical protein
MPSRRGSIVKVSPFVPAPVETTVKPAPAELAAAFAKLKTAKPDFPYRGHAVYAKLGSAVAPTKDLFGWGGAVKLANADAEQLAKDYAVIEALCHSGLWTIE